MTAWTRSRDPVLAKIRPTWDFTVASDSCRAAAISGLLAPRHGLQDLVFARGERRRERRPLVGVRPAVRELADVLEQPRCHPGRDHRLALVHRPDRGQEHLGLGVLEQEATSSLLPVSGCGGLPEGPKVNRSLIGVLVATVRNPLLGPWRQTHVRARSPSNHRRRRATHPHFPACAASPKGNTNTHVNMRA